MTNIAASNNKVLSTILAPLIAQVRRITIITFSEARSKLKEVLTEVVADANYTVITRRDAEDAVLMSLDTFNSLQETVHLLRSPANTAHLEHSIAQYRQGQRIEHNLVDE